MIVNEPTKNLYQVDVMVERRVRRSGYWSYVDWKPTAVMPSRHIVSGNRIIQDDGSCRKYLWACLDIKLVKEAAASYWSNLKAAEPSMFIICRRDAVDGELQPLGVTVDFDEMVDYQDAGEEVFRFTLPSTVYRWVESFIVNYCEPPRQGKRQRIRDRDEIGGGAGT